MRPPNMFEILASVCARGDVALKWGNPEPWVQTEVFTEFHKLTKETGLVPFETEVPYITKYPVQLPKPSNRDWKARGAVKWVDLCLRSTEGNDWYWYEFKVRHASWAGIKERARKLALDARGAFRKDIVALLGFSITETANTWENPDYYTKAYWFDNELKPYSDKLRNGNHHFVSVFLQLDVYEDEDKDIWNNQAVIEQVNSWKANRCKQKGELYSECKHLKVSSSSIGNHWLVLAEW